MRRLLYKTGELIDDYDSRRGRMLSNMLYLLNATFILLYIVTTYKFAAPYQQEIFVIEYGIAITFLFELIARIYYTKVNNESIVTFYTITDGLSIIPVLLAPLALSLGGFAFIRVFYSLRIIRFIRLSLSKRRFFNYKIDSSYITRIKISITILLIFFITASAFFEVEAASNPNIHNFGDALYYSIVAISTAGFGDIVPTTSAGRFVTMLGLLVAITLIPVQIAQARQATKTNNNIVCPRCGLDDHATDARYCKKCSKRLSDEAPNL